MAENAPFVVQPELTAIALTYTNQALIADLVLPRVNVGSPAFKWTKFNMADGFTLPNLKVGRKSRPEEIDWAASEQNDSTQDYGLDDGVPYFDIKAAESAAAIAGVQPIDPVKTSTRILTSLVALGREQRVAASVFALATYPSAQRVTLSGTSQWSDFTNSDPVQAIMAAKDAMLVTPNKLVIGRQAWTKLRTHPKMIAAAYPLGGNASVGGAGVSKQAAAQVLELDEIIVGEAFINSAKRGQATNMARVWGKHAALIYVPAQIESTEGVITFGATAQWGEKIAGTIDNDVNIGIRGGVRVRVGESLKEVIMASDAGYFFQNAVA